MGSVIIGWYVQRTRGARVLTLWHGSALTSTQLDLIYSDVCKVCGT